MSYIPYGAVPTVQLEDLFFQDIKDLGEAVKGVSTKLIDNHKVKRANRRAKLASDMILTGNYLSKNGDFMGAKLIAEGSKFFGHEIAEKVNEDLLYNNMHRYMYKAQGKDVNSIPVKEAPKKNNGPE
jgi:predicted DNA-binding ribbon-helix-helix protein